MTTTTATTLTNCTTSTALGGGQFSLKTRKCHLAWGGEGEVSLNDADMRQAYFDIQCDNLAALRQLFQENLYRNGRAI